MPNLDPLKGTVIANESTPETQGLQPVKVALSKPIPRLENIYFTFILDSLKALPLAKRATHIKESGATPVLQEKFFKRMAYDVMSRRSDIYTSPEAVVNFFQEIKALCSFKEKGQEKLTYDPDHFFTYFLPLLGEKPHVISFEMFQDILQNVAEDDPIREMIDLFHVALIQKDDDLTFFCTNNPSVTQLSVAFGFELAPAEVEKLAETLEKNKTVRRLFLVNVGIDNEGAKSLAKCLMKNETLAILTLNSNPIEAEGIEALAEALRHNKTLKNLSLNGIRIGNGGAETIARALAQNTGLQMLDLGSSKIEPVGIQAIAKALKQNTTLEGLNLGNNLIGLAGVTLLAEALKQNSVLRSLNLTGSSMNPEDMQFGDEGAKVLAKALEENKSLISLGLSSNGIKDAGVKALAETLLKNETLRHIDLTFAQCGNEAAGALVAVLRENTTLASLNLSLYSSNNSQGIEKFLRALR